MSDGLIRMTEEVEAIIKEFDRVIEDFPESGGDVEGQRDGVAGTYFTALEESREKFQEHFREANENLRRVIEIMGEAAGDQRKLESEMIDELNRQAADLEEGAKAPAPTPGVTQAGITKPKAAR